VGFEVHLADVLRLQHVLTGVDGLLYVELVLLSGEAVLEVLLSGFLGEVVLAVDGVAERLLQGRLVLGFLDVIDVGVDAFLVARLHDVVGTLRFLCGDSVGEGFLGHRILVHPVVQLCHSTTTIVVPGCSL
jgi:hypothetical protein